MRAAAVGALLALLPLASALQSPGEAGDPRAGLGAAGGHGARPPPNPSTRGTQGLLNAIDNQRTWEKREGGHLWRRLNTPCTVTRCLEPARRRGLVGAGLRGTLEALSQP